MADKTTGGPSKGQSHGGDQTAMPGQAEGGLPFGVHNDLSTGAPGSGGAAPASEPTLTVPVPATVFGASSDDSSTGAPGGSGATAGVSGNASYTKDSLDAYPRVDATGGSTDTEAQGNKYGRPNGLPGDYQPHTTGAPASGGHASVTNGSERIH